MTTLPTSPPDPEGAGAVSTEAVRAFIGLLGYASLGSFALIAQDASHSSEVGNRITLSRIAAAELSELDAVEDLVARNGGAWPDAIDVFAPILNEYMFRAEPRDWWERMVRSYVGFNLLEDLLRELAAGLPESIRSEVSGTVGVSGHAEFVVASLTPALAEDSKLASRLALWGRRVVGEGLSLAKKLFEEHPQLAELLPGEGDTRVSALMGRLQTAHARRLGQLNLTS